MSIEQEIAARFLTGSDLWNPTRFEPAHTATGYRFPARHYGTANATPARPRNASKILLPRLLKIGDAKQATNAARPLSEFIQGQQEMLSKRPSRPRRCPLSAPPVDHRLWLDEHRYAAWTVCGHLVSIEEPQPGHGSSMVMLAEQEEVRQLLAVNRLIMPVIAFYKGDDLSQGMVTRYMPHHDLGRALGAALERALAFEAAVSLEHTEEPEEQSQPAPKEGFRPLKKSRFHPLGNFIIYREPSEEDDLPPYAIKLFGLLVPGVFESQRKAQRYIDKHARRGDLPQGCKIARVLAKALVRPVMRKGFKRPRDPEKFLEMVRQDARVIEPELHVEWLPRFRQGEDGLWRREQHRNRRTVRHRIRHRILDRLHSASVEMAEEVEQAQIRRSLGVEEEERRCRRVIEIAESYDEPLEEMDPQAAFHRLRSLASRHERNVQEIEELRIPTEEMPSHLKEAMSTTWKAERVLPEAWKRSMGARSATTHGSNSWGVGPEWDEIVQKSHNPPKEHGYWIRAPFEVGKPHLDGLRSRLVELQIDGLFEHMNRFGIITGFWIIKEDTSAAPRWVAPIA